MRLSVRTLVSLLLAVMAGIVASRFVPKPLPELSRAQFMEEVRAGHVQQIEIEDQEVILGESTTRGPFRTSFDKALDASLPDEMRALGIKVRFSKSALGI